MSNMNIKTLDDHGRFAGYASVFNIVDSQNDIIIPGAFKNSVKGRASEIKLLWQHQQDEPIGVFDKMFEDARGLYVEGKLLLDVRRAKEAHALLKAGALKGLSIGYTPLLYHINPKTGIRTISKVDLWEVSLVTFPANEAANVTVIKSAAPLMYELAQHGKELREFFEEDSFEQDTRGRHMTYTERLERNHAIHTMQSKSLALLHNANQQLLIGKAKKPKSKPNPLKPQ